MRSALVRYAPVTRAVVLAIVVWTGFGIFQPGFATVNNTYSIVQGLTFVGLAAVAFGTTMIAGELDLAVPSTATVAGVLALLHTGAVWTALLVGVLVGLLIGAAQGVLVLMVGLHSVVLTLGTAAALIGVALELTNTTTIVSKNLETADAIQHQLFIFSPGSIIAIAMMAVIGVVLSRTLLGTEIRGIGGGRGEAIAAGVSLWRPLVATFVISGTLSGVLGVLVSLGVGSVSATSFDNLLLPAVTAALVGGVALQGGRGTVFGIGVGALTLRFVNSGMSLAGRPFFEVSLAIALLLLVVVIIDLGADRWAAVRRLSVRRPASLPPP